MITIKHNGPARQVRPASIYLPRHREPAPIVIPDHDPRAAWRALLSDVEWAMQRHVISAARFGREAIGDPNLVGDLHAGRMPRIDTVERILGYIDQLDLARVIARFGSVEEGIDRLVDVLIEAKDRIDGDPEAEPGDTEDHFVEHQPGGPGCPVADGGDLAWTEWQTRGRHKLNGRGGEPRMGRHIGVQPPLEDDEDDDPDTSCEDGPAGDDGAPGDREDAEPEHDREQCAEPHHPTPIYGVDQAGRLMREGEAGDSYEMAGSPFADNDR